MINPTTYQQDIHRAPPHSVEAEQGVLGSMLISPRQTIAECVVKINEEYFYVPAHQTIYNLLVELWNAGEAIDLITFTQYLRDRNLLEGVGGASFVTSLFTFVPTAANVDYYLDIMRDKYILRSIIAYSTESVRRAYEEQDGVEELLEITQSKLMKIANPLLSQEQSISELSADVITRIMETQDGNRAGLNSGLSDLDNKTGGFHEGQLIVLAGLSGKGKTSLGLTMIQNLATAGVSCGVISLEMGGIELTERLIASIARVDLHNLKLKKWNNSECLKVIEVADKVKQLPVHIRDDSDMNLAIIRAVARQMKMQHKIKFLFVDYIQLIDGGGNKNANREREIAGAAEGLKQCAKELGIVVVAASQLNDDGRHRSSRGQGDTYLSGRRFYLAGSGEKPPRPNRPSQGNIYSGLCQI